jgi:hypothetical protein
MELENAMMQKAVVRVKYLDKIDLEELGWKEFPDTSYFDIKNDDGDNFQIHLHDNLDKGFWFIQIYNWNSKIIFEGRIKNKSELEILMKQLGI